jgi:hypothetical protein
MASAALAEALNFAAASGHAVFGENIVISDTPVLPSRKAGRRHAVNAWPDNRSGHSRNSGTFL